MKKLKIIKINEDALIFENGIILFSDHEQDCCEHHYLSMEDLTMEDFKDLKFDLSNHNFFRKIENYGIELIPIRGHSIRIPGYGTNNGYYSSNLRLCLTDYNQFNRRYDISNCQTINWID